MEIIVKAMPTGWSVDISDEQVLELVSQAVERVRTIVVRADYDLGDLELADKEAQEKPLDEAWTPAELPLTSRSQAARARADAQTSAAQLRKYGTDVARWKLDTHDWRQDEYDAAMELLEKLVAWEAGERL